MDQLEQYKSAMSEIIAKQAILLGPTMAITRARKVPELTVSDDGKVTEVRGEPRDAFEKLVASFVELSGEIVKNAVGSIFLKHPTLKSTE